MERYLSRLIGEFLDGKLTRKGALLSLLQVGKLIKGSDLSLVRDVYYTIKGW